jgi:hypothetical protein
LTSERNKEQSDYLINRINDGHQKFLEAIKEASPLAVLGSLCIAISAFTTQNVRDAQPFAIVAASLFLIAFLVSLAFKLLQESSLAPLFSVTTYVTVAFGIIFLFGVVYYFALIIPLVSNTLAMILQVLFVVISTVFGLVVWWLNGKFRRLLETVPFYFKLSSAITIFAAACVAFMGILNAINAFMGLSSNYILDVLGLTQIYVIISYAFGFSVCFFGISAQKASQSKKKSKQSYSLEDNLIGCQY